MSLIDGVIGKRNNDRLFVWTDRDFKGKLKTAAETLNMSISDFVRRAADKYVAEVQEYSSRVKDCPDEITDAINKVKNGYQKLGNKVKQYFTEPDDVYLPAYVPADYGINLGYK